MRLRVALVFFFLGFAGVLGKLFFVQVLNHEEYIIMAERQRTESSTIPAQRGVIYSKSKSTLVTNEESYRVYADPQLIQDPKEAASSLASILLKDSRLLTYNPQFDGIFSKKDPLSDKEALQAKLEILLSQEDKRWVSVARKIPMNLVQEIRELGLEGLGFDPDPRRFYPEGRLGAPFLGFVASNEEGNPIGYNGLEGYYSGDLSGRAGRLSQEYSVSGRPILVGESSEVDPLHGSDLYLTVDRGLQSILEQKIREGVRRFGAKRGSFVVLEPDTGKVLAMGNYPNFDPGNLNPSKSTQEEDRYKDEFRNLSIAATYEPGSVMKPVTISAALDSGKVEPDWTFQDDGPLRLGDSTIDTWDGKHWGKQNLTQLLQKSNNVGAAKLALKTGRENLRTYFLNFGFGSQLGIDLEGEESGLVKRLKDWREVDLATAGFGQGVAVTPLQMTAAYSAIANDGVLMKPYMVEKIVDRSGREVNFEPQPIRRVISPETSKIVTELIRSAVSGGESVALRDLEYRVAGKTGTAQIPVGGRYDPSKTNTTFVGFPFKSRAFVMIIRLEEPSTSTFSATTVVPLWVEAFKEIAPLFGIFPDK